MIHMKYQALYALEKKSEHLILQFWMVDLIALDKVLFSTQKYWYFSYFSTKTYVVGTH